jgi:membrane protein DedA with SNARE-associated domain
MPLIPVVAALINIGGSVGYPLLFALIAAESAGALVPGETSLILAGALAGDGKLSLPVVIAVAASAAILGDNVGYVLGRQGLRHLAVRLGRSSGRAERALEHSEEFFKRRGPATVFVGRWLPGLRVFAAWLAGANRMPWPRFLLWNALGGIGWAATIGTIAYYVGRSASGSLAAIGFVGVGVVVIVWVTRRFIDRLHHTSRA